MNAIAVPLSYEVDLVAERAEAREDFTTDYIEREYDNVRAKILRTPDDLISCMQRVWEVANEAVQFEICKSLLWKPIGASSWLNRPSDVASRLAALLEEQITIEAQRQVEINADKAWKLGEYK